jgi:hypothetical protein
LQAVVTANGLVVTALDLQNYIAPWALLVDLLKGLLDRKAITEEQFQHYSGFPSSDSSISGLGPGADRSMMAGLLSASRWAARSVGVSNLQLPIAAVIFPSTAIIIGGFEGQTFSFNQLGSLFQQSFSEALEGMATSLENLHSSVNGIFG